ncbi:MAG: D-alanyl-D-alanine carboxypeptidase/D-alanyl-D-alanine-endopeptidase, partial [Deltaproteobacteria bacterium]|nr:D-alanyl-D-alanine carboxypeptidase/D-alanyl-D-alanine-endopeptidase [Deltaproteobacteria bacterium]
KWETRFDLVTVGQTPEGKNKHALLVTGTGDPTVTYGDMEEIATKLRLKGVRNLEGGIYYDDSFFDDKSYTRDWKESLGEQAWLAPISPFIFNNNTVSFFVSGRKTKKPQPKQPLVAPAKKGPHMEITTQFRYVGQNPELIRIKQLAGGDGLAFDLSGQLPNRTWMYNVATAVKDPDVYYFTALAQAMEEAGIHGNLRFQPWPGLNLPTKKIMVHSSIPLREVIVDINKHSNNLAAESLLRTMASQTKTAGISTEDGLNALRQVMETEFPGFQRDVVMKDGSGLDMENRVTSRFFVRLLNRVREKPFQSEYLASMSLAGWDGTLKPRHFPTRLWGNIRAKSGTLKGVKNLSGYLYAGGDVVVFSLMIKEDGRSVIKRERAQDSVMTALFDLLEEPRRSSTLEPAQAALP